MQLFAGSRNAVRFVKWVVSTISACFAMCYRVPLPQTLVCVSLELPACGDLRHARQHTALHACMCLVLACTPENMRARASCWRARQRTCVHESCAGVHAGEHACTSLVLACTLVNMCAQSRAGLHAGEHACTSLVLTCTPENMRARGSCWHTRQGTCLDVARADLHRPRAGLHCRVPAARLVSRLEIRSGISSVQRPESAARPKLS